MKRFLALVLAMMLALSMIGCGNSGTDTTTAANAGNEDAGNSGDVETVKGGTFVMAISGDPTSFNPDYKSDDNLWPIAQNIYNRLIKLTSYDTVIPDLAKTYEFSEDGMQLTFHLHEDVYWHDGVKFTSEDVKWSYDTAIAENWFKATSLEAVDSIECPDENTVVFNLKAPDVTIIYKLGWYGTFILPKHLYEGQDPATCAAATTNPVGTGPFKFESYEVGVGVTLVKNENFFGDEPNPDKVIFAIYTDQDSLYQAFLKGEIDYTTSIPSANVGDLQDDPDYRNFASLYQNRTYITFNFDDADFGKVEVRKAVQLAVDRPGIYARVGGGGALAEYYVSPLQVDYVANDIKQPDRNIEEAMKVLEAAGYKKDADGFYLHATMDVFEDGNFGDIAQIVKANLAEAGIDLTINMMEYAAWQDKVMGNKNFSITMLAGYQGPDISGLAGRIQTGSSVNVGGYSNDRVDELFRLSNCETDVAKRAEQYREIQQIMHDEVPMILLLENGSIIPIKNSIQGTPYDLPEKAASSECTYMTFVK